MIIIKRNFKKKKLDNAWRDKRYLPLHSRSLSFIPLLFLLLLTSCSNNVLVDDTRVFDRQVWQRFTPESFDVTVDNPDDYYRIDFEVVVDSALMRNDDFPMTVNLYSPDGERRMFYTYITLKENGRWKGESKKESNPKGMRVLRQTIRPYFNFNSKGTYRIEIGQATSQYELEGVESMRLIIEKNEIDLNELN